MTDKILQIGNKICNHTANIDEIAEFVSLLMPRAIEEVNQVFSPRQLIKGDRAIEPLPTDKRKLSSYRTRLGTMLEYALSTQIDLQIQAIFFSELRLTFVASHQYPDFFIRDSLLTPSVRIEMKAVDADSDEQSARFEVLSSLIQGEKDVGYINRLGMVFS